MGGAYLRMGHGPSAEVGIVFRVRWSAPLRTAFWSGRTHLFAGSRSREVVLQQHRSIPESPPRFLCSPLCVCAVSWLKWSHAFNHLNSPAGPTE